MDTPNVVRFYSCYSSPNGILAKLRQLVESLASSAAEAEGKNFPVSITGDFNAASVTWSSRMTNPRGRLILE